MRISAVWVAASVALLAVSVRTVRAESPGLKVGQSAPEFELVGQDGKRHKLSQLRKKGDVAVVFHRSASW